MLVSCALSFPSVARGDGEAWTSFEFGLPVHASDGFVERTTLRLIQEARFRGRSGGLGQMLFRVGPRFDLADWFYVVLQPALYVERDEDGAFASGVRAEVEPTFDLELGDFAFSDRSRIAHRWEADDAFWYYRNMLRVEYDAGALLPFVWGEPLLDLGRMKIDEYRLMAGLQVKTSESTSFDLGYMFRSREDDDGWTQDHIGAAYLVFDGWK